MRPRRPPSDLDCLNQLGRLPGGSVPLLTWLANALALSGQCAEAEVSQQVLDLALHDRDDEMNPYGRIVRSMPYIVRLELSSVGRPIPPPDHAQGFGVPPHPAAGT